MILVSKKLTLEYINNYCLSNNYDMLKPNQIYKNSKQGLLWICSKHGEYKQTWHNHKNGQSCPKCNKERLKTNNPNKRWNMEKMYNYCKEHNLDLPKEGQEYTNLHNKYIYICPKHGEYEQSWGVHKNGHLCKKCSLDKISAKFSKGYYTYLEECKEKGYDLPIEDYINAHTKIKHKCDKGHIYEQKPNSHLHGEGCSVCGNSLKTGRQSKSPKKYIQECREKGLDLPIESYANCKTRIKHKCSKGHIYSQSPDMHTTPNRLNGCPVCNESHGERFIRNYLDKNNIKYIPQKKFNNLKDKQLLSYDFYLPDYKILIEYQGKQHYESFEYFGGKDKFRKQQYHDKLKREYANDNGYRLLELHYSLDSQDKVNKYLDRRIK